MRLHLKKIEPFRNPHHIMLHGCGKVDACSYDASFSLLFLRSRGFGNQ